MSGDEVEFKEWGFTAQEITRAYAREVRLPDAKGILITGTVSGSIARKAGFSDDDILKEIDGVEVTDLEHFKKIYKKINKSGKKRVLARMLRNGREPRVAVVKLESLKKDGKKDGEKDATKSPKKKPKKSVPKKKSPVEKGKKKDELRVRTHPISGRS